MTDKVTFYNMYPTDLTGRGKPAHKRLSRFAGAVGCEYDAAPLRPLSQAVAEHAMTEVEVSSVPTPEQTNEQSNASQ